MDFQIPIRNRLILTAIFILVIISLISCEELQQKYVKQDKMFRLAHLEDGRIADSWLINNQLLSDPDPALRARAAMTIGRIGSEYYSRELLKNLRDSDPRAAESKFFAAGLLADTAFADSLLILAKEDGPAREVALEALGRIVDSSRATDLAEFLSSPETEIVYQAILALWRSGGWSMAEKVAQAGLTTENRRVKWAALYALSRGRRIEGRELYRHLLSDVDPEFRIPAYQGLGRSADTTSLELIATGLNDADDRVVAAAITSLRRFGRLGLT
ncbi:MAG: HEAT repeat domain-containing protein, partial [FCB group bacterium]|nr:HEAT repeat domain-containing protein [FCB group bacterium]